MSILCKLFGHKNRTTESDCIALEVKGLDITPMQGTRTKTRCNRACCTYEHTDVEATGEY